MVTNCAVAPTPTSVVTTPLTVGYEMYGLAIVGATPTVRKNVERTVLPFARTSLKVM